MPIDVKAQEIARAKYPEVLDALADGNRRTVSTIADDLLAGSGQPVSKSAVRNAIRRLAEARLVEVHAEVEGSGKLWGLTDQREASLIVEVADTIRAPDGTWATDYRGPMVDALQVWLDYLQERGGGSFLSLPMWARWCARAVHVARHRDPDLGGVEVGWKRAPMRIKDGKPVEWCVVAWVSVEPQLFSQDNLTMGHTIAPEAQIAFRNIGKPKDAAPDDPDRSIDRYMQDVSIVLSPRLWTGDAIRRAFVQQNAIKRVGPIGLPRVDVEPAQ